MGLLQRMQERKLAQRVKFCVGELEPGEEAYDSNVGMFFGPHGWMEGVLLLTSDRLVFKANKSHGWTFILPHTITLAVEEVGRSRFSAGLTKVFGVAYSTSPGSGERVRVDTSEAFVNVWLSAVDAVQAEE
jgi:hypothetical protein